MATRRNRIKAVAKLNLRRKPTVEEGDQPSISPEQEKTPADNAFRTLQPEGVHEATPKTLDDFTVPEPSALEERPERDVAQTAPLQGVPESTESATPNLVHPETPSTDVQSFQSDAEQCTTPPASSEQPKNVPFRRQTKRPPVSIKATKRVRDDVSKRTSDVDDNINNSLENVTSETEMNNLDRRSEDDVNKQPITSSPEVGHEQESDSVNSKNDVTEDVTSKTETNVPGTVGFRRQTKKPAVSIKASKRAKYDVSKTNVSVPETRKEQINDGAENETSKIEMDTLNERLKDDVSKLTLPLSEVSDEQEIDSVYSRNMTEDLTSKIKPNVPGKLPFRRQIKRPPVSIKAAKRARYDVSKPSGPLQETREEQTNKDAEDVTSKVEIHTPNEGLVDDVSKPTVPVFKCGEDRKNDAGDNRMDVTENVTSRLELDVPDNRLKFDVSEPTIPLLEVGNEQKSDVGNSQKDATENLTSKTEEVVPGKMPFRRQIKRPSVSIKAAKRAKGEISKSSTPFFKSGEDRNSDDGDKKMDVTENVTSRIELDVPDIGLKCDLSQTMIPLPEVGNEQKSDVGDSQKDVTENVTSKTEDVVPAKLPFRRQIKRPPVSIKAAKRTKDDVSKPSIQSFKGGEDRRNDDGDNRINVTENVTSRIELDVPDNGLKCDLSQPMIPLPEVVNEQESDVSDSQKDVTESVTSKTEEVVRGKMPFRRQIKRPPVSIKTAKRAKDDVSKPNIPLFKGGEDRRIDASDNKMDVTENVTSRTELDVSDNGLECDVSQPMIPLPEYVNEQESDVGDSQKDATKSVTSKTEEVVPGKMPFRRQIKRPPVSIKAAKRAKDDVSKPSIPLFKGGEDRSNDPGDNIIDVTENVTSRIESAVPDNELKYDVSKPTINLPEVDVQEENDTGHNANHATQNVTTTEMSMPDQKPKHVGNSVTPGTEIEASDRLSFRRHIKRPPVSIKAINRRYQDEIEAKQDGPLKQESKIQILNNEIIQFSSSVLQNSSSTMAQKIVARSVSPQNGTLSNGFAKLPSSNVMTVPRPMSSPSERDPRKSPFSTLSMNPIDSDYPFPPLSPNKARLPRIRPSPLGLVQGHRHTSASESEDETRKSYRHRNDSVCSTASGDITSMSECISPQKPKEFSSALQRKCRRTEQSRKLAQARRDFYLKFGNRKPDRNKMTMIDLLFYNPTTNVMQNSKTKKAATKEECKEEEGTVEAEEEHVDDPVDKSASDEENEIPAPQIKIGPEGELIIDEQSLVVESKSNKRKREQLEKAKVSNADNDGAYGIYKKAKRSKDWSKHETLKFYKALNCLGTDFTLMCELFPRRTRRELKMKFKKEERVNRALVDRAIMQSSGYDFNQFKHEVEMEEKELAEIEQLKKRDAQLRKETPGKPAIGKAKRNVLKANVFTRKGFQDEPPPDAPKKTLNIMDVLEDSDSDAAQSTSDEDDYAESEILLNMQKPTRSGRVPKMLNRYEAQTPPMRKSKAYYKPQPNAPGTLKVVATTGPDGQPTYQVYMVTGQEKNKEMAFAKRGLANLSSILKITASVLDEGEDFLPPENNVTIPAEPFENNVTIPAEPFENNVTIPAEPFENNVTIPAEPYENNVTIPAEPFENNVTIPAEPFENNVTIPAGNEENNVTIPTDEYNITILPAEVCDDQNFTIPASNEENNVTIPADNCFHIALPADNGHGQGTTGAENCGGGRNNVIP